MKGLFLGILLIVVLGIGSFVINQPKALVILKETSRYTSSARDISFLYPAAYQLQERQDAFEGNSISVVTLTENNVQVPDMSEGPVLISALVIQNPNGLSLENWLQAKSISNFQFSPDKKLLATTVGGEPAVSYTYSGLYENDAVAVRHGQNVYLFFVSWTDAQSPMRADFQNLLKTVQFN